MITAASPGIETVRCGIYTRKSTAKGLDAEFTTLDAQREAALAFVASQKANGWVAVSERYDDGGHSGASTDRPALRRLLADVEAGEVECVVVYRADRLSRSLFDFTKLLAVLERHDVAFVSVTEGFQTNTPAGRLMLNLLASFAEYERALIAERTSDKLVAARRRGRWTGGVPPLGFDLDGGRLVVNEAESLRVQSLVDLYLQTGSLSEAAKEANRRGWTTKSWVTASGRQRGGAPFTANGLHRLLTNPLLVGRIRANGDVVEGEHDAILDPTIFEEVGRRLRSNGHKRAGGSRTRNSEAFLAGIIHCAACDAPMRHSFSSKAGRRYRYYVCRTAHTDGWHRCPVKSVAAGDVEQAVLDEVRSAIASDERLLRAVVVEVRRQRRARIAELKREVRIAELEQKSANGTGPQIATRIEKLRGELDALADDKIADAEVVEAVAEFAPVWDAMTYKERTQVVAAVVERVVYDGDSIEVTFREEDPGAR